MNVDEARGVIMRYALGEVNPSRYPQDYTDALCTLENIGLVNHLPVHMSGYDLQQRAHYHLERLMLIEKAIDDELRASQAHPSFDGFGRGV